MNQDCIIMGGAANTVLRIVCIMLWRSWTSRRGYGGVSTPSPKVWARGLSICRHGDGERKIWLSRVTFAIVSRVLRGSRNCRICRKFREQGFRGVYGGQVEHPRACGHGTREKYADRKGSTIVPPKSSPGSPTAPIHQARTAGNERARLQKSLLTLEPGNRRPSIPESVVPLPLMELPR